MPVRRPAVAGTFYPAKATQLAGTVDALLARAGGPLAADVPPRALVVPHAGYVYSGPVAATAYTRLPRQARLIVVLGPAHFVPLRGLAGSSYEGWLTPLGAVRVEPLPGVPVDDDAHAREHAVEVQLPFLHRLLGDDLVVLPAAVGHATSAAVADAVDPLVDEAFLVVSTDLSHYEDHESARRHDRRTADAVLALDPGAIGSRDACGSYALRGLLELARRRGWVMRELDLRTSGDTAGDRSRVVGYGAFAAVEG